MKVRKNPQHFVKLGISNNTSIAQTQAIFGVTQGEAHYYKQKIATLTTFHPNTHSSK